MRSFAQSSSLVLLTLLLGCRGEAPPSTPSPAETAAPAEAADSETTVTDPFGYYMLDESDGLTAWAQTIDHLLLSNIDDQGEKKVPLWGWIRLREEAGGTDYRLVEPRIDGLHFTFRTEEVGGVSYAFEGEFQQAGEMPVLAPQGVVLQGSLRRLSGTDPASEIQARFLYSPGD